MNRSIDQRAIDQRANNGRQSTAGNQRQAINKEQA
jgi:hypothetical protein